MWCCNFDTPKHVFNLRFVKHIVNGRCITCVLLSRMFLYICLMYTHHQGTVQSALIFIQLLENMWDRILVKMLLLWQEILIVHSNPSMIKASQVESHKHSANLLHDLVKELCLTDCYGHVNPTTRLYTWHNIRSFARLDRIYVSTFLKPHIQCITSTPCPISDHDSVKAFFVCHVQVERKAIGCSMCLF